MFNQRMLISRERIRMPRMFIQPWTVASDSLQGQPDVKVL